MDYKETLRKIWHFIWYDNSIWSWIINVILAFVIIKYLIFPGLGLVLGTKLPIVAVVSSSMEHDGSFDQWWQSQKDYYENLGISKEEFQIFQLRNGFNKGDIIFLLGKDPDEIRIGDVIVFKSGRPDPIIHRVVEIKQENGRYFFHTKGDHNLASIQAFGFDETKISDDMVLGRALFKVPLLGWIKIGFVTVVNGLLGR